MTKQLSISKRPRKLSDIIGQEKIVFEMKKRSRENNFPQTMMFQGSTGTGKTTTGFIVSSLINCSDKQEQEDGSFEPCGECPSCKSVVNESFSRSIFHYDCSHLGVDDVRNLENVVSSNSLYGNEKTILIFEEAQQLASAGAKGALLDLLEKPRKDVHFILLTMDQAKFDKAIRDRCQVYKFKKVSNNDISDYIFSLMEEIDPDEDLPDSFIEEVIPVIVDNSFGSVRKALEDFERCLYSEIYTRKEAQEELGLLDEKSMFDVLALLSKKDPVGITRLYDYEDILTFFNYSWKIISNIEIAEIQGYDALWKEERAKRILKSGNFKDLVEVYIKTNKENLGYFNPNLFLHYLVEFYSGKNKLTENSGKKRRRVKVE